MQHKDNVVDGEQHVVGLSSRIFVFEFNLLSMIFGAYLAVRVRLD